MVPCNSQHGMACSTDDNECCSIPGPHGGREGGSVHIHSASMASKSKFVVVSSQRLVARHGDKASLHLVSLECTYETTDSYKGVALSVTSCCCGCFHVAADIPATFRVWHIATRYPMANQRACVSGCFQMLKLGLRTASRAAGFSVDKRHQRFQHIFFQKKGHVGKEFTCQSTWQR